jgi:hypothetical protein
MIPLNPRVLELSRSFFCGAERADHGTSIEIRSRRANSASARRLFSYRGIVHGSIAPSRRVRSEVGNDHRKIILEDGAKTVACRARTARAVERKKLR